MKPKFPLHIEFLIVEEGDQEWYEDEDDLEQLEFFDSEQDGKVTDSNGRTVRLIVDITPQRSSFWKRKPMESAVRVCEVKE